MSDKRRCLGCDHHVVEYWPDGRGAVRCFAPGDRCGRVTVFMPGGRLILAEDTDAPAWCTDFERSGSG